ncbi:hypothetical protein F511_26539 [Dorcoceras hygrometricum]|uniref:Dystroglycan-like n=1 Tax=Dorcoceras hygrometricum TaxID=472368 RepID=A0A2Z7CML6_9LAMI|nr:hypothetical protein F511_26539 [Dorcoceras hygrometricum]
MASSLISNTVHILFDSVLAMDDEGIMAIFEALVASGLKGFLGCPTVIYETALIEFFQHGSVRDGMVVSTIQGKIVEITEEVFAGTFELPMDGLTDLNEVPKDLVFDARSIFSFTGSFDKVTHERFLMMAAINGGVNINWSRVLFNIFKDMVMPGSKQARGYAVQICCLLKKVQDLELGDFKAFPPLKILTEKTVNRYIAINDKISVEDVEGVADESRVKKIPMKNAASKKRPATSVDEHISKKKRTRVGKAAKSSAIVTVAQEAIPLQIVEPIRAVPAVLPSKPKRKVPKRRLKFPVESDDEIVEEETVIGGIAEKESMPARADHQTLAAPLFSSLLPPPPPPPQCAAAAAAVFAGKLVSGQLDVENPFVLISSGLLVQPDEGVSDLVVDRIGVTTAIYREEPDHINEGKSFSDRPPPLGAPPPRAHDGTRTPAQVVAPVKGASRPRWSRASWPRSSGVSAALVAHFSAALIGRLGRAGSALLGRAHRAPRPRLSRASAAPVAGVGRLPAAPTSTGCTTSRKEAPLSLRAGRGGAPHVDAPWRTLARDCAAHVAAVRVAPRRAI